MQERAERWKIVGANRVKGRFQSAGSRPPAPLGHGRPPRWLSAARAAGRARSAGDVQLRRPGRALSAQLGSLARARKKESIWRTASRNFSKSSGLVTNALACSE